MHVPQESFALGTGGAGGTAATTPRASFSGHLRQTMGEVAQRHCLWPEDRDATSTPEHWGKVRKLQLTSPPGNARRRSSDAGVRKNHVGCCYESGSQGVRFEGLGVTCTPAYPGTGDPHPTCQSVPCQCACSFDVGLTVLSKPTWTGRNAATPTDLILPSKPLPLYLLNSKGLSGRGLLDSGAQRTTRRPSTGDECDCCWNPVPTLVPKVRKPKATGSRDGEGTLSPGRMVPAQAQPPQRSGRPPGGTK